MPPEVIIVGGGIAGLSCAWRLFSGGIEIDLIEAESQAGGNVRTEVVEGFRLERGPHTFMPSADDIFALASEVGLAADIVDQSGAEVWAHAFSVPHLSDPISARNRQIAFFATLYRESAVPTQVAEEIHSQGRISDRYTDRVEITQLIEDDDRITMAGLQWQALHTPGHAGGMLCFYQPEHRVLLSSDHLIAKISSNPITTPPDRPGQKQPQQQSHHEYDINYPETLFHCILLLSLIVR